MHIHWIARRSRTLIVASSLVLVHTVSAQDVTKHEELPPEIKALQEDIKKLKGLKVSGYVQARFEMNESSKPGIKSNGKDVSNLDQFSIRRGRFKVSYTANKWSEVMLQLDATGKGVSLKDAEVTLKAPLASASIALTAGQTKWPFGYEVMQSSGTREMPERSKVVTSLFPGERDRGAKLAVAWQFLTLNAGLFNGNGTEDTATVINAPIDADADGIISEEEAAGSTKSITLNFGNNDRDAYKDAVGRLGAELKLAELGTLNLGASGYFGTWGKFDQVYYDAAEAEFVNTNTPTALAKTRLGADLQVKLNLVERLGATELRGEYIQGQGLFEKEKESDVGVSGYSATLVQALGKKLALAVRYDSFDKDTATEDNEVSSLEPALLFYPTDAVKLTLAYQLNQDHEGDAGADKANNRLLLQLQGKF